MTGYLRHYLLYIFAFFLLIITGTIVFVGGLTFDFSNDAPVDVNEYILIFVMILAGVLMVFVRSRMTAILLNGVLGYSIALFFVIFRAPDLALTQIVIETVTTTLFLLAFYFLPKMKKEIVPKTSKIVNGTIAVLTGLVVTVIGLSVQGNKAFSTIATYFENAYELTGGKNIVNTILGDFRAFDTMLEVVVLFIAGLGVYVLVKLKPGKEGRDFED